jgi:co-chaperonin GroES (HSP10)
MRVHPMNGHIAFTEVVLNKGSIIIPEMAKKARGVTYGKVLAVSDGWTGVTGHRYEHKLKEGDLFVPPIQYVGIKVDGIRGEVCFCREEDIITKLEEDVVFSVG